MSLFTMDHTVQSIIKYIKTKKNKNKNKKRDEVLNQI